MDHCPGTAVDYANAAAQDAKQAVAEVERRLTRDRHARELAEIKAALPGAQYVDIENRFSYHPAATPERQAQHEAVRDVCKRLAHALDRIVPAGRHKSLALTAVEEAMHWANAGVACQREPIAEPGPTAADDDAVPPGRTRYRHSEHPHVVHDVPEHQADRHLTFDNPLITCLCEPTLQPYRGGLRIVHNAFPDPD